MQPETAEATSDGQRRGARILIFYGSGITAHFTFHSPSAAVPLGSRQSFRHPAVKFRIELKPRAEKDLKELPKTDLARVVERLRWLEDDLRGDRETPYQSFPGIPRAF
jgi:hypothetical protein